MFIYAWGSFLQGMGKIIRPQKDSYTSSAPEDILKSSIKIYCPSKVNITNRVGGKRSSFLPTFVFRPLTPPYVPFGIRRFLSADAI